MKRFLLIISLVIGCSFLASCEKETLLTVDQTSISFTDAGGSQTVMLTANKTWSVSSTQSWCKVSPSGGEEAAGSRITISCDANTTYDARNCTVTFTCAEMTKSVTISQATNNGLQVSQTTYEVTKAAQQLNIEVKANVKFSVEVDNGCKDWVKYNSTKALTTSTVVLDIAENKTYDGREGKVTIKQDGGSLSSTITIKQSQLDGLFLSTSEYNLSNEKHTLTVEVSTNVEFDVKPEADWVKYVQTKGLSTKQIVLEVAENDTYDHRETKVNVKQKNGDLSGTITIKQDEKYGILVSQSEYNLTNEAQTIEVEVKYNVDFEVVIPDECKDWIKQVSTKGLNTKNYTFSIVKNETYDNREGSITFKQKNGSLSGTVKVNQSQAEGLIVENKEYTISAEEQQLEIKIQSNINYEVLIDDSCKDWISRIQTKGLVEETLIFQIAKNEGEARSGNVYLKGEGLQEEITIQQETEGYVEFDDANFKAYCIENFDKNDDGEISNSEAKDVSEISCRDRGIQSLVGIEYFTNLKYLDCSSNEITKVDLSKNTFLNKLYCCSNQLTNLDISNNILLSELDVYKNQISKLDLSTNVALTSLRCSKNQLTSINVTNSTKLGTLICDDNQLAVLDVANNMLLGCLWCSQNQLTNLDISKNPKLTSLICSDNQLTNLDVSNNIMLKTLLCYNNQITSLDVSKHTSLESIDCSHNQIPALDVTKSTSLRELHCSENKLSTLDISQNTALRKLECGNNYLTTIDIRKHISLTNFGCGGNQLTSLDVSNNTALTTLVCADNQLSTIDVSNNTKLTLFMCFSNQLTSLDVSNNIQLTQLFCQFNQLTSLDVSNNTALNQLWCNHNPYLTEIWLKTAQTINDFQYDMGVATIKYK